MSDERCNHTTAAHGTAAGFRSLFCDECEREHTQRLADRALNVFAPAETALLDEEHLRLALGGGGPPIGRSTLNRMTWLVPCYLGTKGKRWIWGDVLRQLRERQGEAA